jgi:hypothetical protein
MLEKITCYDCWFHDESANIIFMLLCFTIFLLLIVKVKKV